MRMDKMDVTPIIKMDVDALNSAFAKEDFKKANVFANRIMSNAIISKDPKFSVIGFFLKDISLVYVELKAKKDLTKFTTAKAHGEIFLKKIDLDENLRKYWKRYHEFCNSIREYLWNVHEEGNYKDTPWFTRAYFGFLLDILRKEKEILLVKDNQFLSGIYSEMNRVFRVHGGKIEETYSMSLIRILQLYYEYMANYKDATNDVIKRSIFPHLDSIIEVLTKEPVDEKDVNMVLFKVIRDWRLSFLRFMERRRLAPMKEEVIPISDETKRKLTDVIAKSLEEEVK